MTDKKNINENVGTRTPSTDMSHIEMGIGNRDRSGKKTVTPENDSIDISHIEMGIGSRDR